MALKPHRKVLDTDISYFINSISGPSSTRMERGGGLCSETGLPGSGQALDTSAQAAEYAALSSGRQCLGVLMNDVVNIDQSRQEVNRFKDELQVGNKACILTKGEVVTNLIASTGGMATLPATCYLGTSGNFTAISGAGLPVVGRFLSRPDAEGYVKIQVNVP